MFYRTLCLLCVCWYPVFLSAAGIARHSTLQLSLIADDGRPYPVYAIDNQRDGRICRAWLEAEYGQNYAIHVINNSHRRRGLLIAVDGRNIISGRKSMLARSERMYVLEPWQSATYDGWRTSDSKINQFFFTDAKDSYAGAWQDHSAMGVIAVAVFDEQKVLRSHEKKPVPRMLDRHDMPVELESSDDRAEVSGADREKSRQAGTGFGSEKYSYAKVVMFKPAKVATEKYFYRYEWRETLCQRGIIDCIPNSPNRFWPEHEQYYGYVPPPPG